MLKVNVRQLDNEGVDLEGVLEPRELDLEVLREDSRGVEFKGCVGYRLHVSLVSAGVLVKGYLRAKGHCVCDRCLNEFEMPLDNVEVCHYYEDVGFDEIDISPELREDLLICFPMKLLCSVDCQGIKIPHKRSRRSIQPETTKSDSGQNLWDSLDKLKLE